MQEAPSQAKKEMTKNYRFVGEEYGDYLVDKVRLVREPIAALTKLKPFASKNVAGDIFHIQLEAAIRNPLTGEKRIVKLEKEQTLKADLNRPGGLVNKGSTGLDVALPDHLRGKLTVSDLQKKTAAYYEAKGMDVNKYSLAGNNCQMFGLNMLKASGFDVSPEMQSFADQDAGGLVPKVFRPFLNSVTDLAAWWSNNVSDRSFHAPTALRKNHTTSAQAGHAPPQAEPPVFYAQSADQ